METLMRSFALWIEHPQDVVSEHLVSEKSLKNVAILSFLISHEEYILLKSRGIKVLPKGLSPG
jgi:hypothetical protein